MPRNGMAQPWRTVPAVMMLILLQRSHSVLLSRVLCRVESPASSCNVYSDRRVVAAAHCRLDERQTIRATLSARLGATLEGQLIEPYQRRGYGAAMDGDSEMRYQHPQQWSLDVLAFARRLKLDCPL